MLMGKEELLVAGAGPPPGLSNRALFRTEEEAAAEAAVKVELDSLSESGRGEVSTSASVTGRLREGGGWRGSERGWWSEMMTEVWDTPRAF